MKHTIKKIVIISALALLFFSQTTHTAKNSFWGVSFFSQRPQGVNSTRHIVGQSSYMHKTESNGTYATLSATFEYLKAFKTRRIAEHFFGNNTIQFTGSRVTTRQDDDILADYFGMSPTFDSIVTIRPQAKTYLCDFNFYCGLDDITCGLYLYAYAPVVWAQTGMCLDETINNNGTDTPFPASYMQATALTAPATSALTPLAGGLTFGQVTEGIKFGILRQTQNKPLEEKGLADIAFGIGWNFLRRERGYLGASLRATAPTGTTPTAQYLFEPIVGNGRHWELGVGLNGKLLLWEKDGEQTLSVVADFNFSHLFKACHTRSFDLLNNGFGSKYMLLKLFDADGAYTNAMVPVINKTTLPCEVTIDLQAEGVFMAQYHNKSWTIDVGYNGWLRSRENICITGTIDQNKYGLKGIQYVTGINTNATQSTARLHGDPLAESANLTDDPSPIFISTSDLNPNSAAMPFSLTHKLFCHVTYAWDNGKERQAIPYLGLGVEVEFEGLKEESCPNKNTLSQVGIMLKTGLAF